ncbi:CheR family methyltransferase [Corallococcus macrosporus]|uniref:CheR methyltransferase SAM-binding domain-containing protein n=1 Tax=Myxococcus fulvus (strain ATCC BAA-855 / HW-1) TaxID=483219 RepID=F8CNS1_MYXFH|nr:CheR family methyltransferase [Corallococcus macrosporus]AEI64088.1 CheR methyltransferase SAM-binding domain-containing protein [Corallococcus macrosporus]
MTDRECVELLQWAAPRLRLRWEGFRRVRGQVCKRIGRRLKALGLPDAGAYRARLEAEPSEWGVLDALCRVSISRFYRDAQVFEVLRQDLLPARLQSLFAGGDATLRVWSAGCASGEEPYTLSVLFRLGLQPRFPAARLALVATDADEGLLARALRGCYPRGALRELPPEWAERAFPGTGDEPCLAAEYREGLDFLQQDLRARMPDGPFHLVLCRNVAFTYFAPPLQREVLARLVARLVPGGLLVIGGHESLPEGDFGLTRAAGPLPVFARTDV